MSFWRTSSTAPNTGPGAFVAGVDSDSYFRPGPGTLVDWRDGTTVGCPGVAATGGTSRAEQRVTVGR